MITLLILWLIGWTFYRIARSIYRHTIREMDATVDILAPRTDRN